MADFKLTEVAKKANITVEDALAKLQAAGENVSVASATISAEQMRILGVSPQQMLDKRKERLIQAKERRIRGGVGKEIVMNARTKEEPAPTPGRKISMEDLQKRKNELNKDIQKVDKQRSERQDLPRDAAEAEELESFVEPIEQIATVTPELIEIVEKVEIVEKIETVELPPLVEEATAKAVEPAAIAPATPKRSASPTLERERSPRPASPSADGVRPPRPTGPAADRGRAPRPTGPAADRGRAPRPTGPAADRGTGTRPDRRDGDRPDRAGDRGARPARPGASTSSELRLDEERRNRGERKAKEQPKAVTEEAKKPKAKAGDKTKSWTKTITEGLDELTIEKEIVTSDTQPVEEVEVATVTQTKYTHGRKDKKKKNFTPAPVQRPTSITIGEQVVVSELAGIIGIRAAEIVKKLFSMGIMATVNQAIDAETASLLCIDYGVDVTKKVITEADYLPVYEDSPEDLERRSPVVTVMGHVDHGKTSLLDAIRSTSVAEKEAGGITQHIGAYEVELKGHKITFLDTPGHEAFTSLRARGAQVTDIVILVVAANDGVMPQTKEAIDHAKAAGVRLVVAMNKIDRPDANPDKVRQQLAEYGIISDEWGGEHQFQEISAKQRIGIEDLLERVLLEADVLELKGNPKRPAEGIVIESQLDRQKGAVATILVKNGTLKKGDTFVVGSQMGKVRAMYNYRGQVVKEAGISMPVEVMGFSSVPDAGDNFIVVEDERAAKNLAELRARESQAQRHSASSAISLSDFFAKVKHGEVKELNIILKADAQGSIEALRSSLLKLSNAEVKVNIVHDAIGGINESDVVLAVASKAVIIGFNVRPDANARNLAEKESISIELYSIIYKAIEDVTLALEGMLNPELREQVIGRVTIRQVFSVPKLGKIAGSYVQEGKIARTSQVRVIRDNVVIYDGKVGSLRRFTDDVKEVNHGYECGLSIENYQDVREGDSLEVYEIVKEKRFLGDVKSE